MTGDLVERLRARVKVIRGIVQYGNLGYLTAYEAILFAEAADEIERLRASPPVDELVEALEPFAKAAADIDQGTGVWVERPFNGYVTADDFRRAREVSDRLKGEDPAP